MIRSVKIIGILAFLVLAGCGKFGPLEPRAGATPAPLAYGQSAAVKTDTFTDPSVQARPGRSDELLRRSERRIDDPFDLPPGNEGAAGEIPQITDEPSAVGTDAVSAPKSK